MLLRFPRERKPARAGQGAFAAAREGTRRDARLRFALTKRARARKSFRMDSFVSSVILLFIILDPIGLALILPSLLKNVPDERKTRVIVREMLFALALLLLFFFLGNRIVSLLGLETATLNISGALVLFLIALGMVFPPLAALTSSTSPHGESQAEPFIVPIAIPLFVGPSSISVVMINGAHAGESAGDAAFAVSICAAWLLSLCVLLVSPRIIRALGRRGSVALERVTGVLLILISVQMFVDGIADYGKSDVPAPVEKISEQKA